MKGDLIDLPQDREGTNIARTQILTGQAETQIPGREPNLISWAIDPRGWTGGSPHCLLEVDMS